MENIWAVGLHGIYKIRFREFGGLRLLREYARLGLVWRLVGIVVRCMQKRQSMKYAYSLFLERVETVLIERYGRILDEALDDSRKGENSDTADGHVPNIIWTCWLQGIEQEYIQIVEQKVVMQILTQLIEVIDMRTGNEFVEDIKDADILLCSLGLQCHGDIEITSGKIVKKSVVVSEGETTSNETIKWWFRRNKGNPDDDSEIALSEIIAMTPDDKTRGKCHIEFQTTEKGNESIQIVIKNYQ